VAEGSSPGSIVGATEADTRLRRIGIWRLALPIPFMQAGGPANAYLIENADGTLTLFDTGLGTDDSRELLERGFAEAGRRVEEVSRVLLSHGHVDHYGCARFVAGRSGAPVFVHPADASKVLEDAPTPAVQGFFRKLGVPDALIDRMAAVQRATTAFGERLSAVEPLVGGQRLAFRHFEAQVLHMPGHTPGLICLHASGPSLVLCGDHLLARTSPNPFLDPGSGNEGEERYQALVAYLESIRRLRGIEAEWMLPGHGEPFTDHRAVIDGLFGFYQKRQARILDALAASGRTAFDLTHALFGRASSFQAFLMLSEVVGNLEVLERSGRVRHDPSRDPFLFERVDG
jgi:glyoxylase-like metal-dependent hydrolase (beta-lactamase superfamily II)